MIETIVCALMEQFPRTLGHHRVLVNLVFGGVMYIASLVFTTNVHNKKPCTKKTNLSVPSDTSRIMSTVTPVESDLKTSSSIVSGVVP